MKAATAPRRNSETPHSEDFTNMDHNCGKKDWYSKFRMEDDVTADSGDEDSELD